MPQLTWLGDTDARRASRRVPYRILEPVETVGDPKAENLLIQGDNLEALKALLPFYAGRVKCIFIDPPYNTKSAFEHYDDNLEHSQWLSMMYPRLELLRQLMHEDGSIWVTIDDNEGHYLKALMDEVFGRSRFVASIVWQKRYSRENREAIGDAHDYVFVYASELDAFKKIRNRVPISEAQAKVYKNSNNDPKDRWRPIPMNAQGYRPNQMYAIVAPGGAVHRPPPGRCWSMIESEYKKLLAAGRIYFGKDNNSQPNVIRYLTEVEGMVPWTWWPHDEAGHNDEAKKEINLLFGAEDAFLTPKPERLLQRIINIATNSGDLVLDSFLGSGTTTAVAHKMGRRWIGIEMGEHARTHCLPRLKKVVEGEQGGISKSVGWKGGGGFRFMKLGAKAFFDDGALNADIRFKDLAAYLWFLETRIPHETGQFRSPLLGVHNGTAYVLLYNGIIADRRPESGNVLTTALWNGIRKLLPRDRRNTVIYGEASRFSASRLKDLKVIFKQIPYDISMR
jgi:adenine-specific DNA-methyltransferase